MKVQSYESVIEKDIIEIKKYLLTMNHDDFKETINDLINTSFEIKSIKRKVNKSKDLQRFVFSEIKKKIDESMSFDQIEYHLVFMNILLNKDYQPMLVYKYKLLSYIINEVGFCITTYCLIRHLIKYDINEIEILIDTFSTKLNFNIERYHYLASYILLLEKCYKKAYIHLQHVAMDSYLECFVPDLYYYSPRLYRKYCKKMCISFNLVAI